MGPRTYRGLRASAHRVNVWSLLFFIYLFVYEQTWSQ